MMKTLVLFNLTILAVIAFGLWCVKKFAISERVKNIILIISAFSTVIIHYSSLLFHIVSADGSAIEYLKETPNLILPIYPCNVVMWSCVLFVLCKNKKTKFCEFLADYIFWFGLVSTLVGMFFNVDFIMNPTLADYEVTKSIVAHATLLFFVLLLPLCGYIRVDLPKNLLHIIISIFEMLFIGLYCNLVYTVLVSEEAAYDVNSMFLIHSPFEGVDFLIYPIISLIAVVIYFALFFICELFIYKKGERFYSRIAKCIRK